VVGFTFGSRGKVLGKITTTAKIVRIIIATNKVQRV
jgi:hypothetical protein